MAKSEEVTNLMSNFAIILLSLMTEGMMGMFTEVAGSIGKGMSEAFGADEKTTKKIDADIKKAKVELPAKMQSEILEMKKGIDAQMDAKRGEIEKVISDPAFDEGLSIVKKYKFDLPSLTDRLSPEDIAGYLLLAKSENKDFSSMQAELMQWMNSLEKKLPK